MTLLDHWHVVHASVVAAYAPSSLEHALVVLAALGAALLLGFVASRAARPHRATRIGSWLTVVTLTGGIERWTVDDPVGFRMLAICGVLLISMKMVVSVEACMSGQPPLPPLRWLAFAAGWPGMEPAFFAPDAERETDDRPLIRMGLVRVAIGIFFVAGGRAVWVTLGSRFGATACALVGISLILHFGLFNIGAGMWRRLGVPCNQLFVAPLAAHGLAQFWGRRWNLAFNEMVKRAVYVPLSKPAGRSAAAAIGFGFSGLLHEMAISVPAKAYYGLPLAYFALHGGLVLIERRLARRGTPLSERPILRHVWTLLWLAAPMPILFHPPFLAGVVWPLLGMPA